MDKLPPEVLSKIKEETKKALEDPAKLDQTLEATWKEVAGDAQVLPIEKTADLMKAGAKLTGKPEPKKEFIDHAIEMLKKQGKNEIKKENFKKGAIERMKKLVEG